MFELAQRGPGYAHEMANNIDVVLSELAPAFKKAGEASVSYIANVYGTDKSVAQAAADLVRYTGDSTRIAIAEAGFNKMGASIPESIARSIRDNQDLAVNAAGSMMQRVAAAAAAPIEWSNPSRLFERMGKAVPNSFAGGVQGAGGNAVSAVSSMGDSILDATTNWLRRYSSMLNVSAQEEIALWEKATKYYAENTYERWRVDQNIDRIRRQMDQDSFNHSRQWMEERKFFGELSLREELEAWERVQARYAKGSQERKDADRQVFTARNNLLQEQERIQDRITQAEERHTQAVESRTSSIFNSFRLTSGTVSSDEERAAAALQAGERVVRVEQQLADLRQNERLSLQAARGPEFRAQPGRAYCARYGRYHAGRKIAGTNCGNG
jgi:hypothetical protein